MTAGSFFTEFTFWKGIFYGCAAIYVVFTAIAVMIEPLLTLPCSYVGEELTFPNVLYVHDPCRTDTRYWRLMGLTPVEASFGRHIVMAVILGSAIGYERKSADRPAGIRTMQLVALAASLFTVNSTFVFMVGPMHWDPARVSAALPSGVGFLGAALICKDVEKDSLTGEVQQIVRGLNTAASVWLSAAVGVACGGGLYFVAAFTTALMLTLLRFGPRSMERTDSFLGTQLPIAVPDRQPVNEETKLTNRRSSLASQKSVRMKPSMNFH
ncbi:predicted protein [Thalassiosira pseudonana CCMP1335]|uniref:MgtC/SapB/SrpB/YhiD N-terminal domain-containing protein n=1 Tax=Thalassiosira pseudonana TaxID=35128 RepID=B8C3N9_THAPS|nr:predicted protein [Thalassiosira pseudonana CCMP1335]EED92597.1 predicted protein [Thalassiosira pseudonana CCMP1335]